MAGFDAAFVDALVAATGDRRSVGGLSGVVELATGKTTSVVVEFDDGRCVGVSDREPGVRIQLTGAQIAAWLAGELHLGEAYMRGDVKPDGRTGDLLAALEVLDDRVVVERLGVARS